MNKPKLFEIFKAKRCNFQEILLLLLHYLPNIFMGGGEGGITYLFFNLSLEKGREGGK